MLAFLLASVKTLTYSGGMRFHQARLVPIIWMTLAALNLVLFVERSHRTHAHAPFALMQGIFWLFIFCMWAILLSTSWTFLASDLLQRRGFWRRVVPYESITSVEPPPGRAREAAVIVYGGNMPLMAVQRLTVQPQDFAGFLAELERRAPHAAFHV